MLRSLLALLLAAQQPEPDVTVSARKVPIKPIRNAIDYFGRHCFDASRLTRRPSLPIGDPAWHELSEEERGRAGLAGMEGVAFGTASVPDQAVVLVVPEPMSSNGLREQRCRLVVVGGDYRGFSDRIAALLRGPGTQRHVGDPDGVPMLAGWHQRRWAAIPGSRSPDWHVFTTDRGAETWVRVIAPSFYDTADYVLVDLSTRAAGPPISIIELTHTRRMRRNN